MSTLIPQSPQVGHSPTSLTTASRIVIVGAGTFGLSTAFHLLERGYRDVTILDRAVILPAVDAASTDINKVVRSCYSDEFYTSLAREAIEEWRQPMWEGCYHECGIINVSSGQFDYNLKENDHRAGSPIEDLPDSKAVQAKFLASLRSSATHSIVPMYLDTQRVGSFTNCSGYFNPEGGWAEAERAIKILLLRVREMGAQVLEDQEIVGLMKDRNGATTGVRCRNGKYFEGDKVVLAVGSWSASTFPDLELDSKCLATGQSIAVIQLDAEEREWYNGCHVYLDFESGFYIFPSTLVRGVKRKIAHRAQLASDTYTKEGTEEIRPPTKDGLVKLAIHTAGHTNMISREQVGYAVARKISTPRTITSHPNSGDGLRVPRSALQALREQLRKVYPKLGEKPWAATRMCWYTDSPDGNWVIGPFPGDPALFLATSGSGHGFKFLPNIGRIVVDALEGKLDAETATRFAVNRDVSGASNGERASNITQELDVAELCGPEEH